MATSWQDSFSQQSDSVNVVKKSTADMAPSQIDIFFRETSMVNKQYVLQQVFLVFINFIYNDT